MVQDVRRWRCGRYGGCGRVGACLARSGPSLMQTLRDRQLSAAHPSLSTPSNPEQLVDATCRAGRTPHIVACVQYPGGCAAVERGWCRHCHGSCPALPCICANRCCCPACPLLMCHRDGVHSQPHTDSTREDAVRCVKGKGSCHMHALAWHAARAHHPSPPAPPAGSPPSCCSPASWSAACFCRWRTSPRWAPLSASS